MGSGIGHRRSSDPKLLCLWHRLAAIAPIRPLAWEPPWALGAALKEQKNKKQKTKNKKIKLKMKLSIFLTWWMERSWFLNHTVGKGFKLCSLVLWHHLLVKIDHCTVLKHWKVQQVFYTSRFWIFKTCNFLSILTVRNEVNKHEAIGYENNMQ